TPLLGMGSRHIAGSALTPRKRTAGDFCFSVNGFRQRSEPDSKRLTHLAEGQEIPLIALLRRFSAQNRGTSPL
ncbi:MAG: hypothetical protein ACI93G_000584, partial [Hyphomonas sp.]